MNCPLACQAHHAGECDGVDVANMATGSVSRYKKWMRPNVPRPGPQSLIAESHLP